MNRKLLVFTLCIMAVPALTSAQSVYKWTDENGVTHYGDRKPTDKQSESVSIRTGKGSATELMSPQQKVQQIQQRQAQAEDNQNLTSAEQAEQKQRQANCATARSNLEILENNARIRINEEGEQRYLSSEEIAEKKTQFEEIAKENCDSIKENRE